MKYIKESAIIFGITMIGEFLNAILPLPVPAGVYGLFLLLILLCTGLLKLEDIEATGNFLLDIMPILFIPASVGLIESYDEMKAILVPLIVTCLVSTLVVMGVTGKVTELMVAVLKKKDAYGILAEKEEWKECRRGEESMSFLQESLYFGFVISLAAYLAGVWIKKKVGWAILNPLLVSVVIVIAVLKLLHVDYASYNNSAKYISYLLTPSTVCLAIPLYKQLELLKKNFLSVIVAITSGVAASAGSIFLLCTLFGVEHIHYVSFLPKSITTAIGMGVSEEAGGIVTITVVCIIITGIFGNIIADLLFQILKIREPIARGLALGTSAHAIGTAKALELGEVEGAMSSLSIAVAGLMTVIVVPLVSGLI